MRRRTRLVLLWGLCALLVPALLASRASACTTALVLALDVSASVDPAEYDLQQNGLAQALTDPEVVQAILDQRGIWLLVFEWSGALHQYVQMPWRFIDSAAKIEAAAAELRRTERRVSEFPTSLGYAIGFALIQLNQAPEPCTRRIVDVSGDGVTNDGFAPESVYKFRDMSGISINGLVIDTETPSPVEYYREHVIRGPGAFVEVTMSYSDYANAMRRKFLRELRPPEVAELH